MSNYVERNLYENELIVERAKKDKWSLVGAWILGVLFCWLLLIPLISAIIKTVKFTHTELVLTNRRIVYKTGVFNTVSHDAPLNKITSVTSEASIWGRIFNVHSLRIYTTCGFSIAERIENGDDFKSMIMGQIDHFETDRLANQANWTARAISSTRF